MDLDAYAVPGPLTLLRDQQIRLVEQLEPDPVALCRVAQGLLTLPELATAAGVEPSRLDEKSIRPAADILGRALELSDAPVAQPRPAQRRVVGTCRHFAVLSCALLRARSVASRVRCGFATYFQPHLHVDHWVTEFWDESDMRWVRIDSEILGFGFVRRPDDLAPGEFLAGGEAWRAYRSDGRDPMTFGVYGTENWGAAEIVGNAIRDVAALNKVEMLPWDEWGPMRACYDGGVTAEVESLMESIADSCAAEDLAAVAALYAGTPVPAQMVG